MRHRRDFGESTEPGTRAEEVPMAGEVQGQVASEITVVGQGANLEGSLLSAGSLRIDGKVKGKVNADGDVILSPQSQVDAEIRAQNVMVGGRFKGNINAKGKAEIARGGRVDGNITAKVLVIGEGAIFNGQSIMDSQAPEGAPGVSVPRPDGVQAPAPAKR